MKKFLKKAELQLINGGYLTDKKGNPITNQEFIKAQLAAEYIVTYAKVAKGKDFVGKKADTLQSVTKEVEQLLNVQKVEFVSAPKAIDRPLQNSLMEEALSFISFQKDSSKTEKINEFMQQFVILHDFEQFGLFFEEGIVKLNKIYTIAEITEAVIESVDLITAK
jgi:hypothetical protein